MKVCLTGCKTFASTDGIFKSEVPTEVSDSVAARLLGERNEAGVPYFTLVEGDETILVGLAIGADEPDEQEVPEEVEPTLEMPEETLQDEPAPKKTVTIGKAKGKTVTI